MVFCTVAVVSYPLTSSFLFLCLIVDARAIRPLARRRLDTTFVAWLCGSRRGSKVFLKPLRPRAVLVRLSTLPWWEDVCSLHRRAHHQAQPAIHKHPW